MVAINAKFSTFADGGDLEIDDIVVGLRDGVDTRFTYTASPGIYLPLAGGTMSGGIDMDGNSITGLPTPVAGSDAADKDYVDTAVSGVDPLTTKGDLYTFTTVNARLAVGGTDGQMLQVLASDASGLAWSTATFPSIATSTGSMLYADGTNWVASTSLWVNTVCSVGKILRSDGTLNTYTTATYPDVGTFTGSFLYADGTNWVASTSLWVNTVGANGLLVQSNGTSNGYTTATYPSVATSAGTVLRADGTNWVASTATFADTYGASELLYSNGANTVAGLTTANSAMLSTGATGVPAWSSSLTDGQIMIGATGGAVLPGTITAGTGISVTVGPNSIEIDATGSGIGWNSIAGTTQAAAVDSGYYCANAGATTITLPATCALGQVVQVEGTDAGGSPWILAANTGQTIQIGSSATSSAGSLTAAAATENIQVVCIVNDTTWRVQRSNSAGLTIA